MNIPPTEEEIRGEIAGGRIKPLILSLHPNNQGYSLTLPGKNCKDAQTKVCPYDETELLDCVDRREVPWFLADVFEDCPAKVYYKGCIPMLIRREISAKSTSNSQLNTQEHMAILRPSLLSLTYDLNAILMDAGGARLTPRQKLSIESAFWSAVSEPLCLDSTQDRIIQSRAIPIPLDGYGIRRVFRGQQRSRATKRRKQTLFQWDHDKKLSLIREINQHRSFLAEERSIDWKSTVMKWKAEKSPLSQWKPMMRTKEPEELAERKVISLKQRSQEPEHQFESQIHRVEEITVEMPIFAPRSHPSGAVDGNEDLGPGGEPLGQMQQVGSSKTRIIISKHNLDSTYWGQLQLETPSVHSGPFFLGVETDARHYVYQYLDMVTEGGRKQPISVVRTSPGKPIHVVSPRASTNSASTVMMNSK